MDDRNELFRQALLDPSMGWNLLPGTTNILVSYPEDIGCPAFRLPHNPPVLISSDDLQTMVLAGRNYAWSGPQGSFEFSPLDAAAYLVFIKALPGLPSEIQIHSCAVEVAEYMLAEESKKQEKEQEHAAHVKKIEAAAHREGCPCIKCDTDQNASNFLMGAPKEIRDMIWRLCFDDVTINTHRDYKSLYPRPWKQLSILQVCRAIYVDALPILYEANITFWGTPRYTWPNALPANLLPLLALETTKDANTGALTKRAVDRIFCPVVCNDHSHDTFEFANPLLRFLKGIDRNRAMNVKNVSLMVRFPICEIFGFIEEYHEGTYCYDTSEDHDFLTSSRELPILAAVLHAACPNLISLTLVMRTWGQVKHGHEDMKRNPPSSARQDCINHTLENVRNLLPNLQKLVLKTEFKSRRETKEELKQESKEEASDKVAAKEEEANKGEGNEGKPKDDDSGVSWAAWGGAGWGGGSKPVASRSAIVPTVTRSVPWRRHDRDDKDPDECEKFYAEEVDDGRRQYVW